MEGERPLGGQGVPYGDGGGAQVDQHLLRRSGQGKRYSDAGLRLPVGSFVVMCGGGALSWSQGTPARTASWGRAGGMFIVCGPSTRRGGGALTLAPAICQP